MKKLIPVLIIAIIAGAGIGYWVTQKDSPQGKNSTTSSSSSEPETKTEPSPNSFDKTQFSLTEPTSQWVIVNKKNAIPTTFVPKLTVPDVRLRLSSVEEQMKINTQTAPAIKEMFSAAAKDGVTLVFGSGYRSASKQSEFYNSYKAKDGQAAADTYSARPGHSEHQTGFAVDITSTSGTCHLQICWEDTPEGKWVAQNAYEYGFVLRYQNGKEAITGYQYEPWHFRYVGKELALEINKTNQTLEEFFGLPAAPNYD